MANARQYEMAAARALANLGQMEAGSSLHMIKNGLNGGELSPELGARFDQQRYSMGCHELLNMIPLPWGGIRKRPPMAHVDYCQEHGEDAVVRLIPFIFSRDESRLLELSAASGAESCDLRARDARGRLMFSKRNFLPFGGAQLAELSFCQSADVIFVAQRDILPGKIMRYGDTDWRYESISWKPEIAPPSWAGAEAKGSWPDGESRRVSYEYLCTAIDRDSGEESETGELMRVGPTAPLSESWYVECRVKPRADVAEFRIYRKRAGVFGFVGRIDEPTIIVEEVEDEEGKTQRLEREVWLFEDRNVEPDVADTPPRLRDPFSEEGNRPALVFLHQQRLGFASSKKNPLTVWMSRTGNYESMAASVPPDADDAIEATLAAPEANSIIWTMSDRSGLLLGTQAGEWLMCPGEGNALSPTDLSFQPQCNYGSQEGLAPVRANGGIVFAQRGARVVRELGYSFQDDRYNAADLSILARHIFEKANIVSWCWQQEPWSILWMALSDGSLAGLTWLREHEIMAWHRHETEGLVEQLCCVPDGEGGDNCFMTVLRRDDEEEAPRRSLERFHPMTDDGPDAVFLDGLEGLPFRARCIPCLPEGQLENGSTFLLLRKVNSIKCRVLHSWPFRARILSQDARPSELMEVPARGADYASEALWSCPLSGGWRENARLELIFDGKGAGGVNALLINLEVADMAGGQK